MRARTDRPGRLAILMRDALGVLAVSLGLVLALELVLRTLWPQTLEGAAIRGEHLSERDSLVGIRYLPGSVWRFTHPEYTATYAINADGFRSEAAWSFLRPKGSTRILLLGDSFTFGQGVDLRETWPVLAERELERRGLAVDLLNAGVQGTDTRSQLLLLRRLLGRYQVDAVVLGFLINDLYTNRPLTPAVGATGQAAEPPPAVFRLAGRERNFHLLILARRIVQSVDAGYIGLYLAAPERGEYLRSPLSEAPARQLEITDALLRDMAALCDSLGKPFAVLSIPQQFQVLYRASGRSGPGLDVDLYDRHFAQVAKRGGFAWVAALPEMTGEASGPEELFYRLDGHLTPAGNAAVARVMAQTVVPGLLARLDR